MNTSQDQAAAFLQRAFQAAVDAGHVFPAYAACEAALESGWGKSKLAAKYNNLFGQKQGRKIPLPFPAVVLTTWEVLGTGEVTTGPDAFLVFPDWTTSCRERMALLRRLPAYAPALAAGDGPEFVQKVSAVWSTDPGRAAKVLQIYAAHQADIERLVHA